MATKKTATKKTATPQTATKKMATKKAATKKTAAKKTATKKKAAKKPMSTAPSEKTPRIYAMPFATVYPLYVKKAERKGRTKQEVDDVIGWLTGYRGAALQRVLDDQVSFTDFFGGATLNPNAPLITGVVCGVRIEDLEDPLMKQIRWLDKLVDELAQGRAMERVLRGS